MSKSLFFLYDKKVLVEFLFLCYFFISHKKYIKFRQQQQQQQQQQNLKI
jgi:hypothetical protein